MATAKTPKKVAAAAPAAAKSAARAVKAKPAPARAAVAKAPEDAIVHSAEIVGEPAAQPARKAAAEVTKAVEKATEVAAKAVDATVAETSAEVTKTTDTVAKIAEKPSKAVAVVGKAADKAQDSVLKGVVPFLDFSRDNAILLVAAGNELALGLHKLSLSLLDWSAESCDKGVAAGQAMLSAKSVEEVFDLSQSLAKDGFNQLLKEGSELSALSSKLIEDTIVPLPGRLVAAVEKLASHAA
ncbi:MAG TPA: phasin family protein [Acetobacteraceae bacterium]|nr:phasin family protein [Acetobacteraceae bacterium]